MGTQIMSLVYQLKQEYILGKIKQKQEYIFQFWFSDLDFNFIFWLFLKVKI